MNITEENNQLKPHFLIRVGFLFDVIFMDMRIILTEDQYRQLMEMIKLDIKVGDTIMGGKFKNKKVIVKTIGKNDKGDITINGKPLLRFRILKEIWESNQ